MRGWDTVWGVGERVVGFGVRMLRGISEAIERTLGGGVVEREMGVDGIEFGLVRPAENDKVFVDPLREWELSGESYYRDSRGRRVYLQLDGATGVVAALDFRDWVEDDEEGAADDDGEEEGP